MQNQDITKFEFILTLENNIIIQRFFNVKGYNPQVKKSLDLYQSVKEICEEISYDLKMKSMEFMYENQEFFVDPEVVETETDIKEEYFLLRIKLEDAVFISRIFPAHVYHPKARYSVDIRPKVRPFLSDLTYVLSSDKLETTYSGFRL